MQKKIILTTTRSFLFAAEHTDIQSCLAKEGFGIVFLEPIVPPFPFDPGDVSILVAGDMPLTAQQMSYFPNLSHIARFGVGYDCIDAVYAKNRGIVVTNVPAVSAREVAEHSIALVYALAKDLLHADRKLKAGVWERTRHASMYGKQLGVIGLGKIGKECALLGKNMGMNIGAFDEHFDEDFTKKYEIQKQSLKKLLGESDFISVHLPLTEQTRRLIDEEAFSFMKRGVFLVNTSRGEVIDEAALLSALDSGRVAGAGIDVFSSEPPFSDPVLKKIVNHPNVIVTPHVASFSPDVQCAVGLRVLRNIVALRQGRPEELDRVI